MAGGKDGPSIGASHTPESLVQYNALHQLQSVFAGNTSAAKDVRKDVEKFAAQHGLQMKDLLAALKRLAEGRNVTYKDVLLVEQRLTALEPKSLAISNYLENFIPYFQKKIDNTKLHKIGTLAVLNNLSLTLDELAFIPQHPLHSHRQFLQDITALYIKQVDFNEQNGYPSTEILQKIDQLIIAHKGENETLYQNQGTKKFENIFQFIERDFNNSKASEESRLQIRGLNVPQKLKEIGLVLWIENDQASLQFHPDLPESREFIQDFIQRISGGKSTDAILESIDEKIQQKQQQLQRVKKQILNVDRDIKRIKREIEGLEEFKQNIIGLNKVLESDISNSQANVPFETLLEQFYSWSFLERKSLDPEEDAAQIEVLEKLEEELADIKTEVSDFQSKYHDALSSRTNQATAVAQGGVMVAKYNQGLIAAVGQGHCSAFTLHFTELFEQEMKDKPREEQFERLLSLSEKAWRETTPKGELLALNPNVLSTDIATAKEQIGVHSRPLSSLTAVQALPKGDEEDSSTQSTPGSEAMRLLEDNSTLYLALRNETEGHAIFIAEDTQGYWLIDSNSGAYFFDKADKAPEEHQRQFQTFVDQYIQDNYKYYDRFEYEKFEAKPEVKKSRSQEVKEVLAHQKQKVEAKIESAGRTADEWYQKTAGSVEQLGKELQSLKQSVESELQPLNKQIDALARQVNSVLDLVMYNQGLIQKNAASLREQSKALEKIKPINVDINAETLSEIIQNQASVKEGLGLKLHSFFNHQEKHYLKTLNKAYEAYREHPTVENRTELRGTIQNLQQQEGLSSAFRSHLNKVIQRVNENQEKAEQKASQSTSPIKSSAPRP